MRKGYWSVVSLLLVMVAAPLFAQDYPPVAATVGVYFDEQGTQTILPEFHPLIPVDAYVIIFWEAVAGGTAYRVTCNDPRISLILEEFDGGINLGSAFDDCGVEVGFFAPGKFGYGGQPILVSHLILMNISADGFNGCLCIGPHCSYNNQVVVATTNAEIFEAEGLCGSIPVEQSTWGSVKTMYR